MWSAICWPECFDFYQIGHIIDLVHENISYLSESSDSSQISGVCNVTNNSDAHEAKHEVNNDYFGDCECDETESDNTTGEEAGCDVHADNTVEKIREWKERDSIDDGVFKVWFITHWWMILYFATFQGSIWNASSLRGCMNKEIELGLNARERLAVVCPWTNENCKAWIRNGYWAALEPGSWICVQCRQFATIYEMEGKRLHWRWMCFKSP